MLGCFQKDVSSEIKEQKKNYTKTEEKSFDRFQCFSFFSSKKLFHSSQNLFALLMYSLSSIQFHQDKEVEKKDRKKDDKFFLSKVKFFTYFFDEKLFCSSFLIVSIILLIILKNFLFFFAFVFSSNTKIKDFLFQLAAFFLFLLRIVLFFSVDKISFFFQLRVGIQQKEWKQMKKKKKPVKFLRNCIIFDERKSAVGKKLLYCWRFFNNIIKK